MFQEQLKPNTPSIESQWSPTVKTLLTKSRSESTGKTLTSRRVIALDHRHRRAADEIFISIIPILIAPLFLVFLFLEYDDVVIRSCPGFINRPWRVRKEYLVYSYGSSQLGGGGGGGVGGEVVASTRTLSVNKRHGGGGGSIHHGNGNGSSMKKTTNADLRSKRVSHNGSHYNVPTEATQQTSTTSSTTTTTTTTSSSSDADHEIDCLSAFHAVYHELQLIRSVRRRRDLLNVQPVSSSSKAQEAQFLYLGDVHAQLDQRASYRPTAYQPALIRHHHEVSFLLVVVFL